MNLEKNFKQLAFLSYAFTFLFVSSEFEFVEALFPMSREPISPLLCDDAVMDKIAKGWCKFKFILHSKLVVMLLTTQE